MSMYAYAVIPADETYKKMLDVYNACEDAGIEPPEAVYDFFGGEEPNPDGLEVELPGEYIEDGNAGVGCLDIDLSDIPEGAKYLKVRMYF